MASSIAVNPTQQPRELCRFVFFISLQLIGIFICRYFLSNVCRYGDNCMYSHDRSNGQLNNVCRYYLQGKCSYGERCRYELSRFSTCNYLDHFRYDHVRPKPQTSISFQPVSLPSNPPLQQNFINTKTQPINGGGTDFRFTVSIAKQTFVLSTNELCKCLSWYK